MNKIIKMIFLSVALFVVMDNAFANNAVTSQTRFRIEKLSTPTIKIGNKTYKQGDTFLAGEEVKWSDAKQSMLVKNLSTSEIMRFSKRISEKKGKLKSIFDLYVHTTKGSSRGVNNHIKLEKSVNSTKYGDKRIALIVGNQNYRYLAPLKSAQKDAEDISDVLSELGFDVVELYETDYSELIAGINKFSGLAKEYDVAVVYYAGHGIQEDGINYLIPVDNMLDRRTDLRDCVSCNEIVEKVENSGIKSRIFYFDACRDHKTAWSRTAAKGLSSMEGSPGTVIMFAAESGKIANDGERDGNSPFASSLINNMKRSSTSFSEMMDGVVRDTYAVTNARQYPVRVGTLIVDFQYNNAMSDPKLMNSTNSDKILNAGERSLKFTAEEKNQIGSGLNRDYTEEVVRYEKGARNGNAEAQYKLGWMYQNGFGVSQDYSEAVKWYKKAAKKKGSAEAQNNLGWMYQNGFGVSQDYSEAMKWYKNAAQNGSTEALSNLGWMYQNGFGVPQDYEEALKWYKIAADQGNSTAQYHIGLIYENEFGIGKDYIAALEWFMKAADKGNTDAQYHLGIMYLKGRGISVNHEKALKWFKIAAEQGHATAQDTLGEMYEKARDVPKDYAEAVKWYRRAADQEFATAMVHLGLMYYYGRGVPEDPTEGVRLFRKAADQGDAEAQTVLGNMYLLGKGVPKNHAEAAKWYGKAAEQGFAQAQYTLGRMFRDGDGVLQDDTEAMKWLKRAADQGHIKAKEALKGLKDS